MLSCVPLSGWALARCYVLAVHSPHLSRVSPLLLPLNSPLRISSLASQRNSVVKNCPLIKRDPPGDSPSTEKKLCDCFLVLLSSFRELILQRSRCWISARYSRYTHRCAHTGCLTAHATLRSPSPCFPAFHLHTHPASGYVSTPIFSWRLKEPSGRAGPDLGLQIWLQNSHEALC